MTNRESGEVQRLDPFEVHAQACALADHLQRSGVAFLPTAQSAAVARWSERFVVEDVITNPQTPPETPPPVGSVGRAAKSAPHLPTKRTELPTKRTETVPAFAATEGSYPSYDLPIGDRQNRLDEMAAEVAVCTKCEILSSCRKNTVFGEGNVAPRFAFFGEGPGADEDQSGRPFVGKAGQLLTKMIAACKFSREDAYIFNTVKCRPPGNRNPEPDELQNCRTYYQQQLAVLQPEYIVCLGAIAAQELLKTKLSVGRLRGQLHSYLGSKVLVTYHPAYLLRNPAAKKAAWDDLQLMLRDAGTL